VRPGRLPALLDHRDVYPAGRPGRLAPEARRALARVYVPNSKSDSVDVISQRGGRIVDRFATAATGAGGAVRGGRRSAVPRCRHPRVERVPAPTFWTASVGAGRGLGAPPSRYRAPI
jgi:hypothetical protein